MSIARRSLVGRSLECAALFAVAPTLLSVFMRPGLVFPAIWTLGLLCLLMLVFDPSFDRSRLWNARGAAGGLRRVMLRFLPCAAALTALLWAIEPARLLDLPRRNPMVWAVVMVGYPVLSVYAQEIAFRAFFFHRYAPLFAQRWTLIAAASLAFGYAHIIMNNWWAVVFSAIGGVFFGLTYARTNSLLAACIEHALYGCFLFTIGWGWYFYGGAIAR
ncbi:MAG: CPBP family intramembrane metalloprotease [Phycisphaeraceae bacterium]|nr:CPBP family intramembrane metalloprotease [Phycisphaeraceae bacterium]MBX3405848.1 CPBP family intramembrane metalloprotease [Phycisphaeraceae bacterium]